MKAFIFDCDGIIVDSEKISKESTKVVFKKLGIPYSDENINFCLGRRWEEILDYFSKKYDFKQDKKTIIKMYEKEYEKNAKNLTALPGINDIISNIRKAGYSIGVATSGTKKKLTFNLKTTGLENMFDVLTTCEEVNKGKPDPEIYLLTAEKLNINPQECIVFEDSPTGVTSAKKAGMQVIAITNSVSREKLNEADLILDSLEDYKVN